MNDICIFTSTVEENTLPRMKLSTRTIDYSTISKLPIQSCKKFCKNVSLRARNFIILGYINSSMRQSLTSSSSFFPNHLWYVYIYISGRLSLHVNGYFLHSQPLFSPLRFLRLWKPLPRPFPFSLLSPFASFSFLHRRWCFAVESLSLSSNFLSKKFTRW